MASRFWGEGESESESSIYTDTDYDDDDDDGEEESIPCNYKKPRWLRPAPACCPVHGDDPAAPPHPETVLVDTLAHIDGQRDATTAGAARTNGHSIQVTFRTAHPPRLSHLTVQCPGQGPDAFPTLPRVVATEDDLALLRVPVGNDHEFFVYRAGAGDQPPILRMIPNPNTLYYADKDVGILSCPNSTDRFVIAVSNQTLCHPRYIHLFDSEAWAWSTRLVRLKPSKAFSYSSTSKVITMGGKRGSMGWVDLWRGILVYDMLRAGKDDQVRYIPLPSRKYAFWGLPETIRDITVVNGVVRFFAMYRRGFYSTNLGGAWHADTWTMKRPLKKWQHEVHLKASEIRVDDPRHSELLGDLPGHKDADRKNSLLTRLRAGSPVLSQLEDGVVYILTKPLFQEDKAWVITVDMKTKTLRAMDEFDAGRTDGLMFTCTQSY
ncbi:unnamed protein product [Alopecurus aequalis]